MTGQILNGVYRRLFLVSMVAVFFLPGIDAQTKSAQPAPYTPNEFPEWANDIRRAEIVSIGSFPLSFLFTSLVFDIGNYVDKLSTDPENAADYAPLFFGNANRKIYTEDQKTALILSSVGVSLAIGIIDFIIGQVEKEETRNRELRQAAAGEARQAEEARAKAEAEEAANNQEQANPNPDNGDAGDLPVQQNPVPSPESGN